MPTAPDLAHHRAVAAANDRWSRPGAREAQSAKIREARLRSYEDKVDPERALDRAERRTLAENAIRADMARLALASAKARRARRGGGANSDS
jgi:hypothetical protein